MSVKYLQYQSGVTQVQNHRCQPAQSARLTQALL